MFDQTFAYPDLGKVGLLIVLEALLSADNALILAMIVRHLPRDLQKKALFYGLAGAFTFRLIAILLASFILGFWWLQGIGALYLIFLAVKHFLSKHGEEHEARKKAAGAGFWATVLQAELADIAFAVDSVLVAVAIEPSKHKIWVVYVGAILGVVLLRWAAGIFLRLLEKYPKLDGLAYVLVGWAGVKLLFLAGHTLTELAHKPGYSGIKPPMDIPKLPDVVFWSVLFVIVAVGSWLAFREPAAPVEEPVEVLPGDSGEDGEALAEAKLEASSSVENPGNEAEARKPEQS